MSLGVLLTLMLEPTAALKREVISLPMNMASFTTPHKALSTTADSTQDAIMLTAPKLTQKKPKVNSSNVVLPDPALAYLTNSQSLAHDSKQMIGFMNHVTFEHPEWDFSDTTLITDVGDSNALFGGNPETAAIAAAEIPVPPTVKKKDRLVVALDPGHGGIDPGSAAHNGLIEKELTLDMAKRVELFLTEIDNVDVVMTRTADTGMSRQSRVDKIRAANADVVVSLHFNHLPQTNINLVESFYADKHNVVESLKKQNRSPSSVNLDFTGASKNLAGIMHEKVYNEVANANVGAIDAGVKSETLFVLTRSFTPGVLLELTCISNPAEADRLATVEYRNQLAASIADGLRDYLLTEHSDRFSEILANLDSSTNSGQKL